MRSRAPRAALALAALALVAGCSDLVSSLTPFGLGDRKPDQSEVAYNGAWTGTTDSGGIVVFQVVGGLVGPLLFQHVTGTCPLPSFFTGENVTAPIDDGRFTFELVIDPQGRAVIEGTFVTTDSVSGSYAFDGLASTTGCPTSGSGGFTATKIVLP